MATNNGEEQRDLDVSSTEQQVAETQSWTVGTSRLATLCPEVNSKHKIALLKQGRKRKGTNVFVTKHNADVAKQARYLKKQKKRSTHLDYKLQPKEAKEEAKVVTVESINERDKYQ